MKLRSIVVSHWRHTLAFVLFVGFLTALAAIYGVNMVRWQHSPDFGWRHMVSGGPNTVTQVFERGALAGLQTGDQILAINGQRYSTFEQLFFGHLRDERPGSVNVYTVRRNGRTIDVPVTTGRLGLEPVIWRSGPLYVLGIFYMLLGVLIFLMKPRATESWIFLVLTSSIGVATSFSTPADLVRPTWFYDIRFMFQLLVPASMIHLAMTFPKPRRFLLRARWAPIVPYVPVVLTLALIKALGTDYWSMPKYVHRVWHVYTAIGVTVFLGTTIWNTLKESSVVVRLQSRVILVGIVLGLFIPSGDIVARSLWHVRLFPDPVTGFAVCLTLFPLSIGYTIVKHDLFAIDTIVRRTYGYVLSTGTVVAAYAGLVSLLNVSLGSAEIAHSPVFSIGFALGVVLLFQPLHRRLQHLVDRTFYRQRYDYRTAITGLSEAMTSILDPDLVLRTLVTAVVREMVLEDGAVLLHRADTDTYEFAITEGMPATRARVDGLPAADALMQLLKQQPAHVLRHDLTLKPVYAQNRDAYERTFSTLAAEVVLPMTYKGELRGVLSLGRKKSGKLFTREDVDLLKTMVNQSTIALENARLFVENLQKGRMEEELKIAHEIQMGMLPESAPELPGLQMAARTVPAREVGGDFYDFVEFGSDDTPEQVGVIIADVSGKGVSAGLLMAGARSTYRVLLDGKPSVQRAMVLANQRLRHDIRKGMFVALLYAVIDPGKRTLTLSNAGQTQPIVCGPGSEPVYVTTDGDTFPLGIVADCDYQERTVELPDDGVVVFYTDGVVEAMNAAGELYGFERFLASVHEGADLPAAKLLDKLFADVARFVGDTEQHDDTTIIVARIA